MKIAIYNLKGGVGKTVTTANLAHLYATQRTHHVPGSHRGQAPQVLMIDCDPQGNLTQFYKRYDQSAPCGMREKEIIGTDWPFLSLMPGNMDLYELERSYYESKTVDALADIGSGYDIVLIDCPPAFNAATAAALLAADDVVIPIKLDAFAIQGMANLMRQVENMKRVNPRLRVAGILPVMWYRSAKVAAAETMLRESKLHIFSHIRRSPTVDAMTYSQIPLCAGSRNSGAGRDYKDFVEEYIGGEE